MENSCVYVFRSVGTTLNVRKFRHLAVQPLWSVKKFDRRGVNTITVLKFLCGKGVVAWTRGNSAGRRHFGFAKVVFCAWTDAKISENN